MKNKYILYAFVWMLSSCESDSNHVDKTSESSPLTLFAITRSADDAIEGKTSFSPGDSVRMEAEGHFRIKDGLWTLTGDGWTLRSAVTLNDATDSTTVNVTFPYRTVYDSSTLYNADGLLRDLWFTRQCVTGNTLDMEMKHVFAKVTVRVEESLRDELLTIGLSVPAQVTEFHPSDGSFTLDGEHTVTGMRQADGATAYLFIVPSGSLMRLKLVGSTRYGGSFAKELDLKPLTANSEYAFTLKDAATATGIHTPAEWLDFVTCYHSSRDEAVAKYGVTLKDGVVFRILNDLDFTDTDLQGYTPLGLNTAPFSDILDGMGHTLSHLTLPDNARGLVRKGSETSVVRNLTLTDAHLTITQSENESQYAILVSNMLGRIENCRLSDCTVTGSGQLHTLGLVAGVMRGLMVNCSTEDCTVKYGRFAGGVGTLIQGDIVNCLFDGIQLRRPLYGGAVCGGCQAADNGETGIRNCWTHKVSFVVKEGESTTGVIAGYVEGSVVDNCFVRHTSVTTSFGKVAQEPAVSLVYTYDKDSSCIYDGEVLTDTTAVEMLNGWIKTQGEAYRGIYLSPWAFQSDTSSVGFR